MKRNHVNILLCFFVLSLIISCSKDNDTDNPSETYSTDFKMTDGPIDNANVEAVMVTIAEVKVDGQSLEGFNKTTLDVKALTDGSTQTLGSLDLAAGTYSNLELVLDYETDAAGNTPGCYVLMADQTKDQITATANSIQVDDAFEVFASASNDVVIDFDLRKTIKNDSGSDFEFVTMAELSSGIRAVAESTTGSIEGTVDKGNEQMDKLVVYAYKKGTFNAETETQGQGSSGITFANAVTSAEAKGITNSFSLNFLEEGEYELVFVGYNEDSQGDASFNALLQAEALAGLDLGAISVTSALSVNATVTLTGSF